MNILDKEALIALNLSIHGIFIESTSGHSLTCHQAAVGMLGSGIEEITKKITKEITKLNSRDLLPPPEGYNLTNRYRKDGLFPRKYIVRLNMQKDAFCQRGIPPWIG